MSAFSADMARYRARGYSGIDIWLNPAIWSIAVYRFANYAYAGHPPALLRLPCKVLALILFKLCVIVMEMDLDPQATIGPGFYIGHIGGVHINPGAILGRNCDIAHRVTIGASAMGRAGIPVLGDDVYVGTGATLVGKIKIGDGAKIAANTLVITNVPAGATVMGVPGRIIMRPKPAPTPTDVPLSPTRPPQQAVISTEAPQDTVISTEAPQDAVFSTEAPQDAVISTEAPQDTVISTEAPQDAVISTEAPQDTVISTEALQDAVISTEAPQDTVISTEALQDTVISTEAQRSGETPALHPTPTAPSPTEAPTNA